MQKNRPKTLPILGHTIQIRYPRKIAGGSLHGLFDPDRMEIRVADNRHWESTLLHEILHAILHLSGHGSKLTDDDEEALVTALENGLKGLVQVTALQQPDQGSVKEPPPIPPTA